MQDQIRESVFTEGEIINDTVNLRKFQYIETKPSDPNGFRENLYSTELSRVSIPDWYFIAILLIISGVAWARIVYGKFLNSIWISAYSYQAASKVYLEQGVVQKRFGLGLILLYLINSALFIYLLRKIFIQGTIESDDLTFIFQVFLILGLLVLVRIIVMRLTAFIFVQSELFIGFLYHHFIYNKVLGLILIPFLIAIPYTRNEIQEIIIYTGFSLVFAVQFFRLFRTVVYVMKNIVLLFYLILYLCILEILPVLVIIKILLSLA